MAHLHYDENRQKALKIVVILSITKSNKKVKFDRQQHFDVMIIITVSNHIFLSDNSFAGFLI